MSNNAYITRLPYPVTAYYPNTGRTYEIWIPAGLKGECWFDNQDGTMQVRFRWTEHGQKKSMSVWEEYCQRESDSFITINRKDRFVITEKTI